MVHTQGGIWERYTLLYTHREAYVGRIPYGTHTGRHIPTLRYTRGRRHIHYPEV